ncbi:radical SAM domain protein [Candidatus Vecturithrix granuli]|uniref:Radical SAM domain protein n=1 Tax=Vecturithrix granuli TaxID=1499967 RepID=A0A081BWX7_VECG1|nr:radical SAM domain protein [Candidatus Vecturithrix granuli]
MANQTDKIAFGPVPSRRLGRSVGINNIPPKICTYACVYCQLGRTPHMQITRAAFYQPEEILRQVEIKLREAREHEEGIDYLTFVPDGEPTLDLHLGRSIELLKPLGIKIAVITNASLLWQADVRDALRQTDWVSVKIDAAIQDTWRKIDRPHGTLRREQILQGIADFSQTFHGELVTETMLVHGVNDEQTELERIAKIVADWHLQKSYLAIPTRPPAESWVQPVTEAALNRAYHIFCAQGLTVEYLIGYEGNAFARTGQVEEDLLSITAVHPMRADAVREFLERARAGWEVVDRLLAKKQLRALEYQGHTFYLRTLQRYERIS